MHKSVAALITAPGRVPVRARSHPDMKSPLLACLLLKPVAALNAAPLATPGSDQTKLDIVYKTTAQGPLRLDLHYPAAPKPGAKYPLVIFTHGGGWTTGDKSIDRGVRFKGASALTAQGFCVAST